jgi:pyrroloquinoline quinone biosynthesis protein E
MVVTPDGAALPCHTARMLPGLAFPNVREHGVREIWFDSEGFNRYRGTGWMKEPCASCDQREIDLGGCRCQAYLIANDPAVADPVCHKSPHHPLVVAAVERARAPLREQPIVFRDRASSLRLSEAAEPTISR